MAIALRAAALSCLFYCSCSCGNAPCSHLADAENGLKAKAGDCTLSFTPFDESKCESLSSKCTNDDYQLIDQAATCLEALPGCQAGSESQWLDTEQNCAPPVSADCQPAVEQQ